MLTDARSTVDGRSLHDGLWLSVTDLAREQKVKKQAISKNLKRWCRKGREIPTRKSGKELLVRVADYKRAAGETADQAKVAAEQTKKSASSEDGDPIYAREQARKMAIDADLRQLELEERLGLLLPVAQLREATITCASEIVRAIEQTASRADDLAASAKIPITQARAFIRAVQRDLRTRAATAFEKLSASATKREGADQEDKAE